MDVPHNGMSSARAGYAGMDYCSFMTRQWCGREGSSGWEWQLTLRRGCHVGRRARTSQSSSKYLVPYAAFAVGAVCCVTAPVE